MALFIAYQGFDLTQLSAWYGDSPIANEHHIRIANGPYEQNYYGTFLYYNGGLAGGTVTNTDFLVNGVRQFSIEGLQLPALTAEYYLDSGNIQGLLSQVFAGNDVFSGSAGNDTFKMTGGNDRYLGGNGIDCLVLDGNKSVYSILHTADGFQLSHGYTGATDDLVSIERLSFSDGAVALDLDGNAGKAYRLYQAALDRKPDAGGLGYWIAQLDRGLAATEAANGFIASNEFAQRYGGADSNEAFLNLLYQNVLDRDADSGGLQYWLANMATGMRRDAILLGFSESDENRIAVSGAIGHGIEYVPQWL
ncbi:DUF4214 domain-containing protein [Stutzerimonas zhaodongensis]|uniref:DUF4214 domain-containing protein n=1 Tax=Stutzerimonas zhaodongensis TaxID=1176257 RepID=A0ABX8IZ65_9GAMM|nr:DUF4214 domain-containing protein [Stutzerimonas zhaodongensis]QWV18496.1 DUF4214 domain-containing protein [Stutzerimonas zhaodongensis]